MAKQKKPRYSAEFFDAYDMEDIIQKSDEYKALEREERITGVGHDMAFAKTLLDDERYLPYRDLLFETVEWTRGMDGFVTPSALKTDYRRALKSNHAIEIGCSEFDTAHFTSAFVNDHVVTVLMRYIVAEDYSRYRDSIQLNHADCDYYLCAMDMKRFKWLYEERSAEVSPGSQWDELRTKYNQLDFYSVGWDS